MGALTLTVLREVRDAVEQSRLESEDDEGEQDVPYFP